MTRSRRVAAVLAALLVWSAPGAAQSFGEAVVTAPALKAAFLYNFAKFAEWPAEALATGQRLSLCVVGDDAVGDALERIIKGRATKGHELTMQIMKADGPLRSCHVLYLAALDAKEPIHLLANLRGAPVLTVSDGDKFAESGGVIQLILENDRMRFTINVAAAQRLRIHLSSTLLGLATIIKDEPNVQQ